MSLISATVLIVTVIIVYSVLVTFFSVLFRITGVSKTKSSFQVISLLTNAGYTTGESELIVGDRTRRTIAKAAMLTGYFFSVLIASLFINLFLSVNFSQINSEISAIGIGFGALILFFILIRVPFIRKYLDRGIENLTAKLFKKTAKENYISVLDTYGDDAICKVFLYKVPAMMEGKMIIDTEVKSKYNVNILMYERKGNVRYVTRDTIFTSKDSMLVFGKLESIREVFLLKEHSHEVEKGETKVQEVKNTNEISIISNYDYQVLAEIQMTKVPEILKGKTLIESHIKDYFQINVMMVSKDGKPINLTKDTIIGQGDRVIAFGPYQNIQSVFGELESTQN